MAQSDLVVEAIVEKLKIKQNLFKSLDAVSINMINFTIIFYGYYIYIFIIIGCPKSYNFCLKYLFFAYWRDS